VTQKNKLKTRLKRISKQVGKVDVSVKMCNNCGTEFNEKDNYNWSCLTHKSDYGGEMWWCCGKKNINDKGCIKQKHVSSKEDDMDCVEINLD
jgi:hypothetical protein